MARLPAERPLHDGGSWKDMPDGLQQVVREHWEQLCIAWDRMYPHNPIRGDEGDDVGDKV